MEVSGKTSESYSSLTLTTVNWLYEDLSDVDIASTISATERNSRMDKVMAHIDLYLRIIFSCILCFFAFATNIVNMAVLVRQGVRGCVSLCLFCLSGTDFLSTLSGLCTIPPKIMMYRKKTSEIDPFAIYFFMVYMSAIFYDVSNTLTAFLSLERCLCVCLPLRFKDIFTFRRGAVAIACIYLLCFGVYMPHFLSSGLQRRPTRSGNSTYLALWLSADRSDVDIYINITVHFCLTILNMAVVCLCTLLMLVSLKRSSRFQGGKTKRLRAPESSGRVTEERTTDISSAPPSQDDLQPTVHSRTTTFTGDLPNSRVDLARDSRGVDNDISSRFSKKQTPIVRANQEVEDLKIDGKNMPDKNKKKSPSSRNVNVMRTVIVLCFICFLSNLSRLALTSASYVEPRLRFGKEFDHWYQISLSICYVFQVLNCSLNIFVYYRFNKSFRETVQRLFCCSKPTAR